jgi:hypothetical protein
MLPLDFYAIPGSVTCRWSGRHTKHVATIVQNTTWLSYSLPRRRLLLPLDSNRRHRQCGGDNLFHLCPEKRFEHGPDVFNYFDLALPTRRVAPRPPQLAVAAC